MAGNRKALAGLRQIAAPYRVTSGRKFHLRNFDPTDTGGIHDEKKPGARKLLADGVEWLAEEQAKLFAQDRRSLLLVFQAMDAAGKDGTIKHVMRGVDPQGCQVTAFKQPSAEEMDHDWMWRCWKALPERGRIGIFNRSWYEEVLIVRVHKSILAAQKLPESAITPGIFDERLKDIARFEDYLGRNGTTVLKFFLHVSRKEQKKRFMERLDEPRKNWKFSLGDVKERAHWDEYMAAYEEAIGATATPESPWYVVPADNKWFARTVVCAAIVEAVEGMDLSFPKPTATQRAELAKAREILRREK